MPKPEAQKIPVTLVTGFLGAGKTTLLNHILRQKGNKRVAVIENEVGEINIDNSLVVENLLSKEDLVSMDRGCVCCSLRNDIVGALRELQSRATQRGVTYDAILLETTGLADPAPVAFTFFANSWLSANYRLDSILCLVDAEHLREHLEDAGGGDVNEAVNQIAFADIVLLNKIDRVSEETLQLARDMVRSINVTADVVEVALAGGEGGAPRHPPPAWDRLMGINSFSIERALQVDPGFMDSDSDSEAEEQAAEQQQNVAAPPAAEQLATDDAQQNGGEAAGKRGRDSGLAALDEQQQALLQRQPKRRRKKLHDRSGVGSVGITSRGPLDKYRFNMFMRDLLGEKARDIFRSKGVLCIKGQESTKFVFQGVHETICFGPAASNWQAGEEPVNQIVFIGRSLDRRALVEGFRSCVWVELPDGWTEHHDPRTKRPYYVNSATGQKQWERPQLACALVQSTETSHKQPSTLQPRRGQDGNIVAARA